VTEAPSIPISVVVPSYRRESILLDTLAAVVPLLGPRDELVVVDQTPVHQTATEAALRDLAGRGDIRWIRKTRPSICEAMNVGALLAGGEVILFLDDDVVPTAGLLEAHRRLHSAPDPPLAVCGQVLQPWNPEPVRAVADDGTEFDPAFDRACDILAPTTCNFSIRRATFLAIGGMDENFSGGSHRCDAELGYRLFGRTGRKVRFDPSAHLRHLHSGGGTRAFGAKDSWGALGTAISDHYFAARALGGAAGLRYSLHRLLRAPINKYTLSHPWLIPSLCLRELVALLTARLRRRRHPENYVKPVERYVDVVRPEDASGDAAPDSLTVVLPSYMREDVLVSTLRAVVAILAPSDEVVVVDQTPRHEPATEAALRELEGAGRVRWVRKAKPSICEAMNVGALVARGHVLVFLDDDVVPSAGLLEAHRRAVAGPGCPPAVCGQVLQPWNEAPVSHTASFEVGFDPAYDRPCEILGLMAGNFSIRRETFLRVGGMDENFTGGSHRCDTELGYRIHLRTGRRVAFDPAATLRHLHAGGGTRSFGTKDSWGSLGSAISDYYFALRCLPAGRAVPYVLRRLLRAPVNRYTAARPWLIPSLALRELVALSRAALRRLRRPDNYVKSLASYPDVEAVRGER